ncbi:tyrosine recombinase XerC [Soehngenia longivitae]|uniref:Tyrosine recombinase XerC n=1 Tax=Soehngenia longivitae TaxID=2562294 RepID=A0A4Z0D4F9_9FIRM|nr:tyrosine recombinase XerC [Soehngenia longivitae]TFZ39796.1 tyrosine recombinase XerC [Soehngenia longivitae]
MQNPIILDDFLDYLETIKGTSPNTAKEYYYDLKTFFKFLKIRYASEQANVEFEDIDISDVNIEFIRKVNIQDLYAFMSFLDKKKNNRNSTRSRKVASIRSFFKYLTDKVNLLEKNPAAQLEFPKIESRHPIYLTLDQALNLLKIVSQNTNEYFRKRDYCIITLFLNCGLRLSELASIDVDSFNGKDTLTVIGKGNKERTVFLNESCVSSIKNYLQIRPVVANEKALFLSKRKQRLSNRAIQHMIDKYLEKSGLDPTIYSTHKLRHTAATLMYKYGNVDIRALQEILGHESVSTTQIYTHIDDERLRKAVNSNPLSEISVEDIEQLKDIDITNNNQDDDINNNIKNKKNKTDKKSK